MNQILDTNIDNVVGLLPAADYYALRRASKSKLDVLARSPLHFYHQEVLGNRPHPTESMTLGTAVHCMVLEAKRFYAEYVVAPKVDRRTKAGKEAAAAFEAEANGKNVLTIAQYDTCVGMREAIFKQVPDIADLLLDGGTPEVTALWTEETTGTRCKSRMDHVSHDGAIVIDLKTCSDLDHFRYSIRERRYHVQEAFYRDALAACGIEVEYFIFLAIETQAPYLVHEFMLDANAVQEGRDLYLADLATLAECTESNTWPGRPGLTTISLPKRRS